MSSTDRYSADTGDTSHSPGGTTLTLGGQGGAAAASDDWLFIAFPASPPPMCIQPTKRRQRTVLEIEKVSLIVARIMCLCGKKMLREIFSGTRQNIVLYRFGCHDRMMVMVDQ